MANKKRIEDMERILRYLIRKDSVCNTYKIARELGMERMEVLEMLQELAKEDKVKLRNGSVRAVTRELSEEEKIKTKSEVEYLKERVEELEKCIGVTFNQIGEAINKGYQKISSKNQSREDNPIDPEDTKI